MKEMLKRIKADVIFSAVLCIVLGIILFMYTEQATNIFCRVLAVGLLIMGAVDIITYFVEQTGNQFRLITGIILILLGGWIFIRPQIIVELIPAIIGAVLILHGIEDFKMAFATKSDADRTWIACLIFAVLNVLIGALLIVKAFETASIAIKLIGIALIYDGATDLWIVSRATKAAKEIQQEANAVDSEGKEL